MVDKWENWTVIMYKRIDLRQQLKEYVDAYLSELIQK